MNSKMKHATALNNNKRKCEKYRAEGKRETNKARKQARIARRLAKAKAEKSA